MSFPVIYMNRYNMINQDFIKIKIHGYNFSELSRVLSCEVGMRGHNHALMEAWRVWTKPNPAMVELYNVLKPMPETGNANLMAMVNML